MKKFTPKDKNQGGFKLAVILDKAEVKGELGLELEFEGKRLPHEDETPKPWKYHQDGSLRGDDNGEYVLAKPIAFSELPDALDTLWKAFASKKSTFDDSNRTSVHVHLNCQEFHLNRLASFLGMYFTLEEVLTEWCGEYRVGNLFCLRAKDAPAIIHYLKRFIQNDGATPLPEMLHYGGLNPNALHKFGSIEIRTLAGVSEPTTILTWVSILQGLYERSADFHDPRELVTLFSGLGASDYFNMLLGEHADTIRSGINFTEQQLSVSLLEGIRYAQELCYCRDWSEYKTVKLQRDPFGRSAQSIMNKLTGGPTEAPVSHLVAPSPMWPPQETYDEEQPFFDPGD